MKNILIQAKNFRGTVQRISTHNDNLAIEVYYQDEQKKIRKIQLRLVPMPNNGIISIQSDFCTPEFPSSPVTMNVIGLPAEKL